MTPIFGRTVVDWVDDRISYSGGFDETAHGIGLEENGQIQCGVVYSNYSEVDIFMSIAAETPRWCRRGNLRMYFHYPFVQLGCDRVTAVIAKSNKRARRMVEGLGFTLEGVHRKGLRGGLTATSYGLLKEECRWL